MGRKKIPVFSIVATDSRNARDGRYIEDLGRYYPLEQPAEVQLDEERVIYWLNQGAQPSDTVRSLLRKRGVLLRRTMELKGNSDEEIEAAVAEHLERMAEAGDELKKTAEMRRQEALEAERERAKELEEEARRKAEEERKAKEEAERKAREEAEAAKKAEEAEAKADEDAADEEASAEEASAEEASAEEASDEDAADASSDDDADADDAEEDK
jgi:small subunit ribosomal protein S16